MGIGDMIIMKWIFKLKMGGNGLRWYDNNEVDLQVTNGRKWG